MNNKRIISSIVCMILTTILCVSLFANSEYRTNMEAEQHFEKANEMRKVADYDAAITEYEAVISSSPNSLIAQNAQYWIGQLYFESKQFDAALTAFQKILNEYPTSTIIPATIFSMERVQQAKKNLSLFEAVKEGDIEQVSSLIAEGAEIDTEWNSVYNLNDVDPALWRGIVGFIDRTPLCDAVDANNIDIVRLLVEAGADVNAGEWPSLVRAVYVNNIVIAEYLIDHGANVNYPADSGPLQQAAHVSNNIEMVELLIARGADVNGARGYWPALVQAVYDQRMDIMELLIQQGADVNIINLNGGTPLITSVVRMFYETNENSYMEIIQLLIANGADVNIKSNEGSTALQFAALLDTEVVQFLLEAGADVNAMDDYGQTALSMAAAHRNHDIFDLLLTNGADISAKNNDGQTALHIAAQMGYNNSVELVLTKGADVNLKDIYGRTPLYLAAVTAHAETVELLLNKGADINAKDDNGRTALHAVTQYGNNDVVDLLLTNGADINAKDTQNGYTALHLAAEFGKTDIIELLIDRGADINSKDNEGHTPLYIAVNNNYEAAEMLIDKGADSSIETESGKTLLELAQKRKQAESPVIPDMIFDGDPNSYFGLTIVCNDVDGDGYDDILIGEHLYSNSRGRVYLFYGGPDMDTTADLIFEGQNEGDWFGYGIVCGDIDNDDYNDIIIAAARYGENQGRAYLYWGSDRSSLDANPDKIFDGENEVGSCFGAVQPAVYDIDNDGYGDIILGAFQSSNETGRTYLYYGNSKELMDTSYDLIFKGENPGDLFGATIACGDVDNDGYGDIVIGSYRSTNGRVNLYYGGSKASMDAESDAVFEAESEVDDYFGRSILCVDQNRDGYEDIVIGARGSSAVPGRAYLFHGNSNRTIDIEPDIIFEGEIERSQYGESTVYGDIDGDNVKDIIIAEPGWGSGLPRIGRVYVYWGNELSGSDPKPGKIIIGEDSSRDPFGTGLACGDVNNDGFDDIVIGVPRYNNRSDQGRVYLYCGGPR